METKQSLSRNYGIDLLRMVSMYMVCVLHMLLHGQVLDNAPAGSVNYFVAYLLFIASYCGVNCFALISGYVGITSNFKYRKITRLWLQAFFYTAGIGLLCYFVNPAWVGKRDLVKALFPVCTGAYWYLTAYALMFFAIPQLNLILEKMDKVSVKRFIWIFFFFFSLIDLFPIVNRVAGIVNSGCSALWLAYLYIIGGFIRKYGAAELFAFSGKNRLAFIGGTYARLGFYLLCTLAAFGVRCLGHEVMMSRFGSDPFCLRAVSNNTPFILFAAIALFELFSHLKIERGSKVIDFAAPLAFGVYLIHENELVRRNLVTGAFAKLPELSPWLFPFAVIGIALAVYAACSLIDYIRQQLFKLAAKIFAPRA